MRVQVINLDRHPDRMALMARQLDAVKLPFERLKAIDREQLDADALAGVYLSPGEVACHMSHKAAWRRLIAWGDDYGLILEDDVVLSPSITRVATSGDWIPRDAAAIKIECHFQDIVVSRARWKGTDGFYLARLRSGHFGTAGYIIARRLAERLLAAPVEKYRTVDACLFGPQRQIKFGGMVYQIQPALCAQLRHYFQEPERVGDLLESDLEAERAVHNKTSYPLPFRQKLIREVDRALGDAIDGLTYMRDRVSGGRATVTADRVAEITPRHVARIVEGEGA